MDAQRAAAWLVVDSRGRRSVYLDEGRADQQAATLHGVKVPLVPVLPLPKPEPDAGVAP